MDDDGFGTSSAAELLDVLGQGYRVEVMRKVEDYGQTANSYPVRQVRHYPHRQGLPGEVEVWLEGGGFFFAGPQAPDVTWRFAVQEVAG